MAGQQEELIRVIVLVTEAGQRLDAFLAQAGATRPELARFSRSKLQKLIEGGAVTLNGEATRSKELVREGDIVEVTPMASAPSALTPLAMELSILYEDASLIVINKPVGIAVHPGAGDPGPTLVQGLLHHVGKLGRAKPFRGGADDDAEDDLPQADEDAATALRPGIVHRLDKDTSGVLVVAKTDAAHAHLAKQFHDKTNEREYAALLDGAMPSGEIVCETYLFRDPTNRMRFQSINLDDYARLQSDGGLGTRRFRLAKSLFKREETFGARVTLATVKLFTGRTHQIRVHAVALRLPVIGDPLYHRAVNLPERFSPKTRQLVLGVSRQLLHAKTLAFTHPESGVRLSFHAPYPADFQAVLDALRAERL